MSRSLSIDEVSDLVEGATILGTGGGGEPKEGFQLLESDVESGRTLQLTSPLELDPKSYVICTYSCGSIRAPGRKRADKEGLSVDEDVIKRCLETMKRELDGEISAVIPTEMGGHNTAIAIHSAALLGLPAIDGDQAGRAAPELSQSTYQVHGVRATPAVVANDMGDMVVVHEYANIQQYERICRDIAVLGGGHAFVIDSAVNAKEVSKSPVG